MMNDSGPSVASDSSARLDVNPARGPACTAPLAAVITALLVAVGAPADDIPDAIPPFLSQGLAPNLVLTMDDSLSMGRGDAPQLANPLPDLRIGSRAYYTCPDINQLYFDPNKTYSPGLAVDGSALPIATDFTRVAKYPYGIYDDNAAGCDEYIDLTKDFRPVVTDYIDDFCDNVREFGIPARPYYHLYNEDHGYKEVVPAPPDGDDYTSCAPADADCTRCGDAHGESGDDQAPDECFDRVEITDDQMQAFAIWYAYYRTRLLAVQTVVSQVMHALDDDIRLSYQSLGARFELTPDTSAFKALVNRFSTYSINRNTFYDWLFDLVPASATYLMAAQIRAGEFVSQGVSLADDIDAHKAAKGGDDSGGTDPDDDNACGIKCRHNFHLMLTDGDWKDQWGKHFFGITHWPETTTDPTGKWISINQDGSTYDLPEGPFGDLAYDPDAPETAIFADDNIGTLADAAFYYWVRDLDGLASNNEVPPLITEVAEDKAKYDEVNFWDPRNDPAHWQHLTLFAVGLGVEGAVELDETGGNFGVYESSDGGETTLIEEGFPDCTDEPPYSDVSPALTTCSAINTGLLLWPSDLFPAEAKIDDLYHAGLNGRGGYYDASNPADLLGSFEEILNTISAAAKQEAANAPVAISAGGLSDSSRIYQAVTDTSNWTGEVRALRVSQGYGTGNCPDKPRGAFCEEPDAPFQTTDADGSFADDPDSRIIFTMAKGTAADFDRGSLFSALSTEQQRGLMGCAAPDDLDGDCTDPGALGRDNPHREIAEARIDWLRGDDTPSIDGSVVPSPPRFRERDSLLGDILGSGPLVVGNPRQLFADPDYADFKKIERDAIVYVGANDGMLHAFNADSNAPKLEEEFAYVPGAIYAHLADLADPAYGGGDPSKKAFVDGPLTHSDAKFAKVDGSSGWRTVLVGALGRGAQGIYALDITDPTPSLPGDVVLWEFTDSSGSDTDDGVLDGRDMGYNLAAPAIVRIDDDNTDTTDPTWVVLVGNGYGSTSTSGEVPVACSDGDDDTNCTISQTGAAVLYLLRLGDSDTTRILARMDTGVGAGTDAEDGGNPGFNNGLMKVSTLDEDGDLIADRAYAADLFGNVWRFDLKQLTTPPLRIFQAVDDKGNAQPITTRIAFTDHPNGGHMLLFGTGRFVKTDDKQDLETQTFYGIWDDDGLVHPDGVTGSFSRPTRANLLQHAFVETTNVKNEEGTIVSRGRTSTKHPVYTPDDAVRGWRIDLEIPGDVAGTECTGSERVVVDPQVRRGRVVFVSMIPESACAAGGSSWVNALDALDGSRLDFTPFDFNLDGGFDSRDLLDTDDDPSTQGEVGSSIRVLADNGTGIYSAPSLLGLGGGEAISVISDSEGDLIQLEESNAYGWRTWLQLE